MIVQENEIVMGLFGIVVLIFMIIKRKQISSIPYHAVLITGYTCILSGWIFTILESFILSNMFNIMEHFFYALSALFILFWCWIVFHKQKI